MNLYYKCEENKSTRQEVELGRGLFFAPSATSLRRQRGRQEEEAIRKGSKKNGERCKAGKQRQWRGSRSSEQFIPRPSNYGRVPRSGGAKPEEVALQKRAL